MSWQIDPAHSQIQFAVRHMMISTVRGEFEKFGGTIDFDPEHPERSEISVRIETASINTRQTDRDNHLRSADFFHAEEHPVILFEGTRVEQTGPKTGRVVGDLTIRGVTREVVLDVEYAGMARSPWGATSAGFSATTSIDRKEWGLTWNQALETGGVLVGDKIKVSVELEIVKQEVTAPEAAATN
jgi:polyisoprenoid-binding protein YceI